MKHLREWLSQLKDKPARAVQPPDADSTSDATAAAMQRSNAEHMRSSLPVAHIQLRDSSLGLAVSQPAAVGSVLPLTDGDAEAEAIFETAEDCFEAAAAAGESEAAAVEEASAIHVSHTLRSQEAPQRPRSISFMSSQSYSRSGTGGSLLSLDTIHEGDVFRDNPAGDDGSSESYSHEEARSRSLQPLVHRVGGDCCVPTISDGRGAGSSAGDGASVHLQQSGFLSRKMRGTEGTEQTSASSSCTPALNTAVPRNLDSQLQLSSHSRKTDFPAVIPASFCRSSIDQQLMEHREMAVAGNRKLALKNPRDMQKRQPTFGPVFVAEPQVSLEALPRQLSLAAASATPSAVAALNSVARPQQYFQPLPLRVLGAERSGSGLTTWIPSASPLSSRTSIDYSRPSLDFQGTTVQTPAVAVGLSPLHRDSDGHSDASSGSMMSGPSGLVDRELRVGPYAEDLQRRTSTSHLAPQYQRQQTLQDHWQFSSKHAVSWSDRGRRPCSLDEPAGFRQQQRRETNAGSYNVPPTSALSRVREAEEPLIPSPAASPRPQSSSRVMRPSSGGGIGGFPQGPSSPVHGRKSRTGSKLQPMLLLKAAAASGTANGVWKSSDI